MTTDTTDQQAVTVAQEELDRIAGECSDDATRHLAIRNPLNRAIYKAVRGYTLSNMVCDDDRHVGYPLVDLMSNPAPCDISTGEIKMVALVDEIQQAIETAGLASVSSASADYVLVPRKLTDDMHEAVVKLDFTSTHDPLWPEYWAAMLDAAPKSEPVPATNQAGEVERLREALKPFAEHGAGSTWLDRYHDDEHVDTCAFTAADFRRARAALATQPATSQEGEACVCGGAYTMCEDGHAVNCPASNQRAAYLAMTAATPTPPTLSEDLRVCLRNLEAACDDLAANRSQETYRNMVDCDRATPYLSALDDARHAARAALAQVKAS